DDFAAQLPGGDQYTPRPRVPALAGTTGSVPTAPVAPQHFVAGSPVSLTPRGETPVSVLEGYLGKGKYQPAKSKESHSAWFWAWVVLSALALGGLVLWLTVYLLTS